MEDISRSTSEIELLVLAPGDVPLIARLFYGEFPNNTAEAQS